MTQTKPENPHHQTKILRKISKDMERKLFSSQKKVWKMLRKSKMGRKDMVRASSISISEWKKYFYILYTHQEGKKCNIQETDEKNRNIERGNKKRPKELKNRKT